mgnify:CR=1 FL=1
MLLLSVHDERTVAESALAAGAHAVVLKRCLATDLMPAVDAVLAGKRYLSSGITRMKQEHPSCSRVADTLDLNGVLRALHFTYQGDQTMKLFKRESWSCSAELPQCCSAAAPAHAAGPPMG